MVVVVDSKGDALKRRRDSILLSLSFLSSRRGSSVRRMQAIAWSSRTFSLFCRPLRRGKSASERSLPRFPPQWTLLRFVHPLLPPPACSNYEKECSFATRRGTRNGQRPLETIIEQRGPLCVSRFLPPHHPYSPPLFARIFNPATAISGKALSPGAT